MNGSKTCQNQFRLHEIIAGESDIKKGKLCDSGILSYMKASGQGSVTVEASIITTVVISIIFVIIYGCILAFHQSLLKSAASKAAQLGAVAWVDSRMDIETGKIDYGKEKDPIYSNILHDDSFHYCEVYQDDSVVLEGNPLNVFYKKRIDSIRKVVLDSISKSILKPVSTRFEVFFDNAFAYRQIKVRITQNLRIPFGFLQKLFGSNELLSIKAESSAFIAEPTEYIRNIDLAVEYFHRIKDNTNILEKFNEIKAKLKNQAEFE